MRTFCRRTSPCSDRETPPLPTTCPNKNYRLKTIFLWLSLTKKYCSRVHRIRLVDKFTVTQDQAIQEIIVPWNAKQDAEVVTRSKQFPEGHEMPASHAAVLCARPLPRILQVSPSPVAQNESVRGYSRCVACQSVSVIRLSVRLATYCELSRIDGSRWASWNAQGMRVFTMGVPPTL